MATAAAASRAVHPRKSTTPETIKSYAPATGALLGEVEIASVDDVTRAVASARKAQSSWKQLRRTDRVQQVLAFRDAMMERADELVDLLSRECGKPRHEALLHEVIPVADLATFFATRMEKMLAPRPIEIHLMKYRRAYLHYRPRGVIAIISPWNFPFSLSMGDAICALLAGNAVVVKPSEHTPLILQRAKEIFDAAGLPPDLFQVVQGYAPVGTALIEAGVDKVVFTGSVGTGRKIASLCGEHLIPCTLELGGKAPLIACEDADLERTARAIVFGGFANCGQVCVSVERVYAHSSIHDHLLQRVVALVKELRQGDPTHENIDLGAITFAKQVEVAEAHIADATRKGAEVMAGGKRKTGPGTFFEPTVLGKCTHQMTVLTDELFGPIVPFMKVESEEEAIRLANDSHLGLNAYVFTKDRRRGCAIAEQIDSGSVVVNDVLLNHVMPETPFGGVKQSGIGRVHGEEALRDMSHAIQVNVDRFGSLEREPIWYPYTPELLKWATKASRALFGGGTLLRKLGEFL
ncbi:MAG: aldehyde dehydrogenase family protein [Polyangiales bacterium]